MENQELIKPTDNFISDTDIQYQIQIENFFFHFFIFGGGGGEHPGMTGISRTSFHNNYSV